METTLDVSDPTHVGEVRRAVISIGHEAGLSRDHIAQAALVATELTTNILKYAKRGIIALSNGLHGGLLTLDILALDKGPGMANVTWSSTDGHSTGGSLGIGIGTINRAVAVMDIYSGAGVGTALLAIVAQRDRTIEAKENYVIGTRMTPIHGEVVSGDAWVEVQTANSVVVAVVDGLGHGPKAAEAAAEAVAVVRMHASTLGPAEILRAAHDALRTTRGAVMAIARLDLSAHRLTYAGVGNIASTVYGTSETPVRLLSTDGTIGYSLRTPRQVEVAWNAKATLVMHSDGLLSKWNLLAHDGLLSHHPKLIAGVLHRDFARDTDDAAVLVLRAM